MVQAKGGVNLVVLKFRMTVSFVIQKHDIMKQNSPVCCKETPSQRNNSLPKMRLAVMSDENACCVFPSKGNRALLMLFGAGDGAASRGRFSLILSTCG